METLNDAFFSIKVISYSQQSILILPKNMYN